MGPHVKLSALVVPSAEKDGLKHCQFSACIYLYIIVCVYAGIYIYICVCVLCIHAV